MSGKRVLIFGTGQMAEVAEYYLREDSHHTVSAFVSDPEYLPKEASIRGIPAVSLAEAVQDFPAETHVFLVAVGFRRLNALRKEKYEAVKTLGYSCIRYVHSTVNWNPSVAGAPTIGDNCFILENQILQPFVHIGSNVVLWSGNHIGHHSSIGNHCFISSHVVVSGGVQMGERCFVGVNATLGHNINVGARSVLGASTLILNHVPEGSVFASAETTRRKVPSDKVRL